MDRNKTFRVALRKMGPFEAAVERFWMAFQQQTGCDLELEAVALDLHPLHDAILGSGGMKAGHWDVVLINTDWIAEAWESGAVENLKPYVERSPPQDFPDDWPPSLLRHQAYDENLAGMPFHDGPECLIYRKDLFEDPAEQESFERTHGKPLSVPETWDDFVLVARHFQRPESNLYGTAFAAYPDGHNTVYDFSLLLWTRGGEILDGNDQLVLNSEEAVEAMGLYRRLLNDNSLIHPKCRDLDSVSAGIALANGEIAMAVNWFGYAVMCDTIDESNVKGKIDIAPIPHEPGAASASLNVYWIWTLAGGSPHKALAYDFIRFCISRDNDRSHPRNGVVGCRKSTWNDQEVNDFLPYYHKLAEIHENAREFPRIPHWSQWASLIDTAVLEVINTDRPIQDILDQAQVAFESQ
jgi:multiple sugar transport system substrate-binding protein